jgi:AcrR family transcriptional regulator
MEGIARAAGVSKQTLYRWWPTKAAIVLEALNTGARAVAPAPDTGRLETDLRRFVRDTVRGAGGATRVLAGLMAEAQLDAEFAEAFRGDFLAARREVLAQILERARGRGELAGTVEIDFLVELVFGVLWYRILAAHARLDRRFADRLTDALLTLARAR